MNAFRSIPSIPFVLALALAGCATALLADSAQAAAVVNDVRVRPSPERTRIVFDLTEQVQHNLFSLENPSRLVIDIKDAEMAKSLESISLAGTPISNIRSARHDSELRVVLDLEKSVKPRSFALRPVMQYGDRLVVDLYTDEQELLPAVHNVADVTQQMRDVIVVIDAGHGGDDPGAVGHGRLLEKNIVLAIAKQLDGLFTRQPGYQSVLTRSGDYYLAHRKRMQVARDRQADVFLSIHADAFETAEAHGASVYAISQKGATSEAARWLAEKENRADLIGGVGSISLDDKDDELAEVLLDLVKTRSMTESLEMGESILAAIGKVNRLHKRHVEQAAFLVLKAPDVPSLLIETGFISNPAEAKKLATAAHQQKIAEAIFNGVMRHIEQKPPTGSFVAWKNHGGQDQMPTHVTASGDTLSEIADRYRVSFDALKKANGLSSDTIRIGQILKIPAS